ERASVAQFSVTELLHIDVQHADVVEHTRRREVVLQRAKHVERILTVLERQIVVALNRCQRTEVLLYERTQPLIADLRGQHARELVELPGCSHLPEELLDHTDAVQRGCRVTRFTCCFCLAQARAKYITSTVVIAALEVQAPNRA